MTELLGGDLLIRWLNFGHRELADCPHCGETCLTVGITNLAYTHEVCSCGTPEYPHLVERLWHVRCLVDGGTPDTETLILALEQIRDCRLAKTARLIAADALNARAPMGASS